MSSLRTTLPPEAIAFREKLARSFAQRLRARPEVERTRQPSINLNTSTAPELYAVGSQQAAMAWQGVEALQQEGLVEVGFQRRNSAHLEPWHRNPRVRTVAGSFVRLAALGKVGLPSPFTDDLTHALVERGMSLEQAQMVAVRSPMGMVELSAVGAAQAVFRLRELAATRKGFFLREVSARLFQARSKILDGREDWISLVLGGAPCPWPSAPVQLQVSFPPAEPASLLLVENLTTFESLRVHRSGVLVSAILLYTAGFKAAAERVGAGGLQLYFDREPPSNWRMRLEALLRVNDPDSAKLPMEFFGDLDFAGMAILKALRRIWPRVTAWREGYQTLVTAAGQGSSHAPGEADKAEQKDPGDTGCAYADSVLLPLLRSGGRFVDQEICEGCD